MSTVSSYVHWARYANTYYVKAKRAGFTMAAAEYLADRKECMRKARALKNERT